MIDIEKGQRSCAAMGLDPDEVITAYEVSGLINGVAHRMLWDTMDGAIQEIGDLLENERTMLTITPKRMTRLQYESTPEFQGY